KKVRFTREYPTGKTNNLLKELFISEHLITNQSHDGCDYYICITRDYQPGRSEHAYIQIALWTLPGSPIDRGVVDRLDKIADCDKEMKSRVEKYYNELAQSHVTEKNLVQNDITA